MYYWYLAAICNAIPHEADIMHQHSGTTNLIITAQKGWLVLVIHSVRCRGCLGIVSLPSFIYWCLFCT